MHSTGQGAFGGYDVCRKAEQRRNGNGLHPAGQDAKSRVIVQHLQRLEAQMSWLHLRF
jgi:hypothetical protein